MLIMGRRHINWLLILLYTNEHERWKPHWTPMWYAVFAVWHFVFPFQDWVCITNKIRDYSIYGSGTFDGHKVWRFDNKRSLLFFYLLFSLEFLIFFTHYSYFIFILSPIILVSLVELHIMYGCYAFLVLIILLILLKNLHYCFHKHHHLNAWHIFITFTSLVTI